MEVTTKDGQTVKISNEEMKRVAEAYAHMHGTETNEQFLNRALDNIQGMTGFRPKSEEELKELLYRSIAGPTRRDIELLYEAMETIAGWHTKKVGRTMTFGQAIEAMKNGKKVTRKGWNGKGMFLWLMPEANVKAEWCKEPVLKKLAEDNGGEVHCLGTIRMYTAQGAVLTGWLASQSDMLAEDWMVVE